MMTVFEKGQTYTQLTFFGSPSLTASCEPPQDGYKDFQVWTSCGPIDDEEIEAILAPAYIQTRGKEGHHNAAQGSNTRSKLSFSNKKGDIDKHGLLHVALNIESAS
jgi:hypothetical protein